MQWVFKMQKFFPSFSSMPSFENNQIKQQYERWVLDFNLIQIRFICTLTAVLYIISAYIDTYFAPNDILTLKLITHLFLLPVILFFIALLTLKAKYYKILLYILTAAPILAAGATLIIISKLNNPSIYIPEVYLILFWIFTVSGLPLLYATISAVTTFTLVIITTCFIFDYSAEVLTMHCFWMTAAFSFGFLGSYLLEKSNKSVFLTHMKLEEAAVTDKLTGLYNRGKLDEFLHDAFRKSKDSFALILIDIDDFKYINDNYGHLTGDKILEKLSALLKVDLLSTDKIIRWGGEEFMIISHHSTYGAISKQVESLCQQVQAYDFAIEKDVTISIGFTLSIKGDTIDSIIRRADTALYIAKHSGKNCIKFLEN